MDQNVNYVITITDEDEKVILSGEGKARVLYYLSQVAVEELETRGEETESTVLITQGDRKILGVTIDSDSAAGLIKNRINKLRTALKAAESATTTA